MVGYTCGHAAELTKENHRPPHDEEYSNIRSKCIFPAVSAASVTYTIEASRHKHELFREEFEWRLIFHVYRDKLLGAHHASPDKPIIKFRNGLFGITPYVEYPLNLKTDKSPLRRIVVGPCPYPEESKAAIELLLAANDIQGVKVDDSKIPYRNW